MKRILILILFIFSSCATQQNNINYIQKIILNDKYTIVNIPRGYKLLDVIRKDSIIEYSIEKMDKEYEPCDYIDFTFNDTIKIRFLEKTGFDL